MKNLIAFGYFGGKNSKLNFILPQLKTEHCTYVESCAGSAAVLLNKPQAEVEVLNDKAEEIANFFLVLRERPDELIHLLNLTPPGEVEFKRVLNLPPTDDVVEKARRFFVQMSQGYGGLPGSKTHEMYKGYAFCRYRKTLSNVAARLANVLVENTDAARLIRRTVTMQEPLRKTPMLFYIDPPYVPEARKSKGDYIHDDFDHAAFLDAVLDAPSFCKFAISGYPNKLYDSRLTDWHRVELEVPLKAGNFGDTRTEVLWGNYPLASTAQLF